MSSLRVGNYQIQRIIGEGSQAIVVEVKRNNQIYALKQYDLQEHKHILQYIENQIEVMQRINHSNVINLVDVLECKKKINIVTEYCEQGNLKEFISVQKHKKLDEEVAMKYFIQMLQGLQAIHQQKVVHRDIKPENILFSKNQAKLTDLGLHRPLRALALTKLGTPLYMAPELMKQRPYGFGCDIWSMGCVLVFMLTGSSPFHAKNEKQLFDEIKQQCFFDDYKLKSNNIVTQEVQDLISRMLRSSILQRATLAEVWSHPAILKSSKNAKLIQTNILFYLNHAVLDQKPNQPIQQSASMQVFPSEKEFSTSDEILNKENRIQKVSLYNVQQSNMGMTTVAIQQDHEDQLLKLHEILLQQMINRPLCLQSLESEVLYDKGENFLEQFQDGINDKYSSDIEWELYKILLLSFTVRDLDLAKFSNYNSKRCLVFYLRKTQIILIEELILKLQRYPDVQFAQSKQCTNLINKLEYLNHTKRTRCNLIYQYIKENRFSIVDPELSDVKDHISDTIENSFEEIKIPYQKVIMNVYIIIANCKVSESIQQSYSLLLRLVCCHIIDVVFEPSKFDQHFKTQKQLGVKDENFSPLIFEKFIRTSDPSIVLQQTMELLTISLTHKSCKQ